MIDHELAGFLEEGLGIHVGTRDERLRPAGSRAIAARIEHGGRQLVVYLPATGADRLRPHLEANGQAAVTFGRPVDERSCQVKGVFVDAWEATAEERPLVVGQREGFLRQLELIGIPRLVAAGWVAWPAVAIRLKVTAVFEQTPGPDAGYPIP
jgi:hypothetical protein